MNNELIRKNLTERKNNYLVTLNSIKNLDGLFNDVLQNLKKFDFKPYQSELEFEILENLKEWWTNPEKGIKKDEELFAILFEYDHFFRKNVEASAYGIGEWKDYKVQADKFDMGWNYDFTTEFYACPGIELNFFDSLESLDYSNLPKEYTNDHLDFDDLRKREHIELSELNDIELIEGYDELIELHKCEGMIAIHDVLSKLDTNNEFESLNYRNNFMFLIHEHDSGEVYPLLIKNK